LLFYSTSKCGDMIVHLDCLQGAGVLRSMALDRMMVDTPAQVPIVGRKLV
jgi:hypothetical protein